MMHDTAWRAFGAASFGLILFACAGGDTPSTDDAFEQAIADRFANGAVASAGGSGGRAGSGGSGQSAAGRNAGGSGDEPVSRGGSGQLPDDGDDEPLPDGECDGFAVLAAKCSGSTCHGASSPYSNFAESEAAALSFVGESGEASCASAGPLIDPENPAASIIIQKVSASSPPCGSPMPVIGGKLAQTEITCLQEWIGSL